MFVLNQRGNVLLFVISGIVMIAAIATGMFYMSSTSTIGQVSGNGMDRAYYLAMAGKDYALADWQPNDGEFIISSNERFELSVTDFKITSIGIVNKDTPFEARKTIISVPPSPVKRHFLDTFSDPTLPNWNKGAPAEVGEHEVIDGALHVKTSLAAFGSGTWGFLQFKTAGGGGIDFTQSWENAGYCLSYDLQVKINNTNTDPYYSYMAGLNFKIAGSGDAREFYGISFLRARRDKSTIVDNDDIPSGLKPDGIWDAAVEIGSDEYSQPAVVLWKRQGGSFTWLAYKLLTIADFVIDASGNLVPWSNLQVRLIEGYPLGFTNGGPSPLLAGAIITGETSGAYARISGTPVITSGNWASSDVVGTLALTNINGTFAGGENLLVNGTVLAKASGTQGTKTNFIRAYFADVNSHGTLNNIPTDSDNRGGNLRVVTGTEAIHWPVDNVSNWKAENDYMTLVQWDGVNTDVLRLGGSGGDAKEGNAVIQDNNNPLLTPDAGAIDYSGIALHATGDSASSTYFDDFAVQY